MKKLFIAFIILILFSTSIIFVYAQNTNTTLNDNLSLDSSTEQKSIIIEKHVDITLFIFIFTAGIILMLLYRYLPFFSGKNEKYRIAGYESHSIVSKTKYDDFNIEKLEKITNRLINNYRILISIYAVLFAFIISTNLDKAFSNWAFIIWTGWTLAIIVRTGITSLELTDIIEIADEKNLQETARKIFAFNTYVKHALYLLVPAVAFLPILFFEITVTDDMMSYWDQQTAVLSIAWGIFGMFVIVYLFAIRVSTFIYSRGSESFYIFTILLVVLGALQLGANSPIEPKSIMFLGITESIPAVLFLTSQIGYYGGVIAFMIIGRFLIEMLWDKIKRKRNDSKNKE